MTKKEVEEMVEKMDEKAYYRWLLERDKKRLSKFNFLSYKSVRRALYFLLHSTGIHQLKLEQRLFIGTECHNIYSCEVCNYKCTELGVLRELGKWGLGYLILVPLVFLPIPKAFENLFVYLWLFFFMLHTFAGLKPLVSLRM